MDPVRELSGKITVKFSGHVNLEELCVKHIPGYEATRYEIVAIRVLSGHEFIITVYAADKLNHTSIHPGKLMVKKFKIQTLQPAEFMSYIQSYNFTIVAEPYDAANMEVINK